MEGSMDVEKVEIDGNLKSLKFRVSEVEVKNGRLEEEVKRLKNELEFSVEKIQKLEMEKARLGNEVCVLRRRNTELASRVKLFEGVSIGGDSGESVGLYEVKVENENMMLECGKRVAEEDVKGLKDEKVDLDGGMKRLEERVVLRTRCGGMAGEGELTPSLSTTEDDLCVVLTLNTPTPVTQCSRRGNKFSECRTDSWGGLVIKRKLVYNHGRSGSPIMSPGEPARKNYNDVRIIEISDSEDDEKISLRNLHIHGVVNAVPVNAFSDDDEEENFVGESSRNEQLTSKRKRVVNFVASDSDSDDIPIGMRLNKNLADQDQKSSSEDEVETVPTDGTLPSVPRRRRRLMSLSQLYEANGCESGAHSTAENVSDDGLEDTKSEGESLGGFIVKSSDSISSSSSPNDCSAGNDASVGSHLQSDSDMDYGEIMSKLRRDKDCTLNWESEADVLAAFGKDSALCLEAVCALYRRQTSDERESCRTLHVNGRGFNQLDALRGSELALFLTDGDPLGPVKKSVKDLEKYDPDAVELCRKIAIRYSKQLVDIFIKREDPFFPPEH